MKTKKKPTRTLKRRSFLYSAIRRTLDKHYRTAISNNEKALAGDPIALHDLRVALRRFNTILRLFRKELKTTNAESLARSISSITTRFGPIRDLDVWFNIINEPALPQELRRSRAWRSYVAYIRTGKRKHMIALRRLMRSKSYRMLFPKMKRFLDIQMRRVSRQGKRKAMDQIGTKILSEYYSQALKEADVDKSTPVKEMHSFRKLCRKTRYLAEFLATTLGSGTTDMGQRFRAVSSSLGIVHDCHVALDRIKSDKLKPPRELARHLKRKRKTAWNRFERRWCVIDARIRKFKQSEKK